MHGQQACVSETKVLICKGTKRLILHPAAGRTPGDHASIFTAFVIHRESATSICPCLLIHCLASRSGPTFVDRNTIAVTSPSPQLQGTVRTAPRRRAGPRSQRLPQRSCSPRERVRSVCGHDGLGTPSDPVGCSVATVKRGQLGLEGDTRNWTTSR